MSSFNINDYIRSGESNGNLIFTLDYQKIYRDMEKMTGFQAKARREQHYHYVVGLFEGLNNGEISHNASDNAGNDEVPF